MQSILIPHNAFVLLLSILIFAGNAISANTTPDSAVPTPQIFAPGIVSGPANDGSPTFSRDGNTMFFSRSSVQSGGMILESHKRNGQWTHPVLASFSGSWPDSSPELAPDGSYLVFQSTRPVITAVESTTAAKTKRVSNLYRVDRDGDGWGKPWRLPDTVNIGNAIWKPSVDAMGNIYFVVIDKTGAKRLYSSLYRDGKYQQAQPLAFSDGTTLDVDPEIAPDGSFMVFCSAGRMKDNPKDHLYFVRKTVDGWGPVIPMRYAGDELNGYSTDDEPHLGPDLRTVYFVSDRAVPLAFPRTPQQAQEDFLQLERTGWFGVFSNVWTMPINAWLDTDKTKPVDQEKSS